MSDNPTEKLEVTEPNQAPTVKPIEPWEYRKCSDILEEARNHLLDNNLYLSHAVCLLGFPRLTREIMTAGIAADVYGSIEFLFNPDFLIELYERGGAAEVAFILAHETFHLYACHVGKIMEDKDPDLWNVCADVIVNTWLLESGMFNVTDEFRNQIWDAQKVDLNPGTVIRHLDVESIYQEIMKDPKRQKSIRDRLPKMGFGNGTLDDHKLLSSIDDPVLEEVAKNLEKGGYNPQDPGKNHGNTPSGAVKIFEKIKETFDWQRHLLRFISSVVKRETTWERRNRRLTATFPHFLIPHERMRFDHRIIVYGDMSGSIDAKTTARFVSIIGQAPTNIKMDCFTFDTRIYDWDIKDKPKGGGGTDFQAVVDHAQQQGRTDAYIVLTDGYCSEPTVKVPKKWLWLTTAATLSNRCGRWMHIGETNR